MSKEALQRAVRIVGSQEALADKIRAHLNRPTFSQQTISFWIQNDTKVAAEYWPAIEQATDMAVTRRDMRPDIFPAEQQMTA